MLALIGIKVKLLIYIDHTADGKLSYDISQTELDTNVCLTGSNYFTKCMDN